MSAIVFSDPNCPFCYATEERLHRLGLAEQVEWRGVEHAPHLPVPAQLRRDLPYEIVGHVEHAPHLPVPAQPGAVTRQELEAEVASIRARAPEVAIEVPAAKPNTGRAILRAAAAIRHDRDTGRDFARSLYAALWSQGRDLSDEAVLDELASASGVGDIAPTADDEETVASWRRQWAETGLGGVPLLLRDDGRSIYGLVGEDELRVLLA